MSTEAAGDGRPGAGHKATREEAAQETAPGRADARDGAGAEHDARAEPGADESERTRALADDDAAGQRGEPSGDGEDHASDPGDPEGPDDDAYAGGDYAGGDDYDGGIAPDADASAELIEFAEAVELDEPVGPLRPRHWRTRLFIAIGFLAAAAAVIIGAVIVVGKITHGFKQPVKVTYHVSKLFSLQTGDCFDPDGSSSYTLVSCDSPHEAEVFGTFALAAGKWPGSTAVAADASSGCATRLTSYLNPQLAISLTSTYAYPDETAWEAGTRTVICEVRAASGQITGSVKGASATIG